MNNIPLYEKLRPKKISKIIGNEHLKKIIKKWIENKSIKSFVIHGKPGSGKSTFVRAIINEIKNEYNTFSISGAMEGSKTLKNIITQEKNLFTKQKLLFVDEIYRLNKAEQDTLLLAIETGEIILIGATTENPAITLNPALLSRLLIFKINDLKEEDYAILFENISSYYNKDSIFEEDVIKTLINYSNGDLRRIINLVEAVLESGETSINNEVISKFIDRRISFDKINDKYNYISAFIKSVRGSDPDAALLYLAYMLENGEDPMYIARRIVILAGEDIGLADPNALNLAVSAMIATEKIGYPECVIPLAQVTVYLSSTLKSNSSYSAYFKAKEFIENNNFEIQKKIVNPLNKTMEKQGYGKNYKYAHDYGGFVKDNYMPDGLESLQFFFPKEKGIEKKLKEILKILWGESKRYD